MGKSQKIETSYLLTPEAAAAYLRRLSDQLEAGKVEIEAAEVELSDRVKIKESLKDKAGKRSIKINLKLAGTGASGLEAETEEEAGQAPDTEETSAAEKPKPRPEAKKRRPSYKGLKKKMSSNFKALKAAVRQGEAPEPALVERFVDQCRQMVTYPGKGDPYYEDFTTGADELARGAAQGDLAVIGAALDELGRLRKNCHQRFK